MLSLIQKIWEKHPELRLAQMLGNCFNTSEWMYYQEDEVLEKRLKEVYDVQ